MTIIHNQDVELTQYFARMFFHIKVELLLCGNNGRGNIISATIHSNLQLIPDAISLCR